MKRCAKGRRASAKLEGLELPSLIKLLMRIVSLFLMFIHHNLTSRVEVKDWGVALV